MATELFWHKDYAYELTTFAYNKEMDQLMLINNIANTMEEDSRSPTYLGKGMIKMNDEKDIWGWHLAYWSVPS